MPKILNRRLVVPGLFRARLGLGPGVAAMKAERDGDDYVLNGSKIWTTYAQWADWMFCLVRTSSEAIRRRASVPAAAT
jgi:alkylation response protein AidB-like acyl-CoA dehydrogenase